MRVSRNENVPKEWLKVIVGGYLDHTHNIKPELYIEGNNFKAVRAKVLSYSTPICYWDREEECLILDKEKYSRTTSRHQYHLKNAIREYVKKYNFDIFVLDVPVEYYINEDEDHRRILRHNSDIFE